MIRTGSGFLLNPKMVALAIDLSVCSITHSWGTVSGAGGLAELPTDICTSVWIKLLSLTGKHSKLSFIFLKNEKTEEVLFMPFLFFFFTSLTPLFMDKSPKESQILKLTSHTHTQSSHRYLHCSTPSPWALLLKRVFLPQPASRLSLEQLFLTSWIPAFLQTWGTSRALPCVLWGVPGLSSKCSFCRAGEKVLVMITFIFGYTNLTWAYTCLSKALGFNLWFSWAWCAA